jgi:putative tryptophan/tyrosine transport system substrate-binding protein
MLRREFLGVIGSAAATWPLVARAQGQPMPVIGFLGSDSPDLYTDRLRAFRQGLREGGYIESENVAIEYRWANGKNDQLPALAADLVRLRAAVLVASTTPSVLALKEATASIPIVFFVAGDPSRLDSLPG